MTIYLLLISTILLLSVLLNRISGKIGIPALLAFIILGMMFGSDGFAGIPFNNYGSAGKICSTALIFIMFYGGFGTNWKQARPVIKESIIMSTLGVVLTCILTAVFCHLALGIGQRESFLFGAVISSTDAASVFSILRSRKLNLKYNTASLLEVESGSNDPCSYMLTIMAIELLKGDLTVPSLILRIFTQLIFGAGCGILIALVALLILKRYQGTLQDFESVFMISIALFSYAIPALIGGNGYLGTYITGIIIGNSRGFEKKRLVNFFDGMTGLMQILIFFLLGLLSSPSNLPRVASTGLLIALFLTFVARPIAVLLLLGPMKKPLRQQVVISWSGLRGAASIVFSIIAITNVETSNDLFHTVFFIVLFSILFQGSLLPYISTKLNMIDDEFDVMKTFNDYTEETPLQFIEITIPDDHPWSWNLVKEISIPMGIQMVLIRRANKNIVPKGDTRIMPGDNIIISALEPSRYIKGIHLVEKHISEDDHLCGKKLSEIPENNELVIIIKRNNKHFVPDGDTTIQSGDVLIINS